MNPISQLRAQIKKLQADQARLKRARRFLDAKRVGTQIATLEKQIAEMIRTDGKGGVTRKTGGGADKKKLDLWPFDNKKKDGDKKKLDLWPFDKSKLKLDLWPFDKKDHADAKKVDKLWNVQITTANASKMVVHYSKLLAKPFPLHVRAIFQRRKEEAHAIIKSGGSSATVTSTELLRLAKAQQTAKARGDRTQVRTLQDRINKLREQANITAPGSMTPADNVVPFPGAWSPTAPAENVAEKLAVDTAANVDEALAESTEAWYAKPWVIVLGGAALLGAGYALSRHGKGKKGLGSPMAPATGTKGAQPRRPLVFRRGATSRTV